MNSTIKLPSGKLIDLSHFVALLPDDDTTENNYKLSLAGLNQAIEIDSRDAEFISQKIELESRTNHAPVGEEWDKEAQLRKNQPLMKLIEQWRARNNGQTATEEEIQEYQDIQESLTRNPSIKQVS
ncbi:MAG: hypothetical protein QNJ55_36675 [Xenococcus sp. MO_188.B8]|nr:hypothetical protein [Xenococcus sp. MO_188.B8]